MIALSAKITSMLALGMDAMMLICVAACAVVGGITAIIAFQAGKKGKVKKENHHTDEQQDVLTQEQEYLEANDKGQIVMSRNVIYAVGIDGQVRAGRYAMTSADESDRKFNVRYNGLVREYLNGDMLTLTDGDTISPVSGSVVLSRAED